MSRKNTEEIRKLHVRHQRLRKRNAQMSTVNRLAFCILVIALCAIIPVTALPSLKKSDQLEEVYQTEWKEKLRIAAEAKDSADREHRAIQQDPRYLLSMSLRSKMRLLLVCRFKRLYFLNDLF